MLKIERQLTDAGLQIVEYAHANGKWVEVVTPDGEEAIIGRQNAHCFHAFGRSLWTASGSTAATSINGCIGDVLDDTRQTGDLVYNAPRDACIATTTVFTALARMEFQRRHKTDRTDPQRKEPMNDFAFQHLTI